MPYEAKNFEGLIGMDGFSEKLLRDHFMLYQGYVTNFNKLDEILQGMEKEGEFGSYAMWEQDFKAMGAMRGIGWVVLYHDASAGRLFNVWVNEHDVGHFAGAAPLAVMDVFEHAYIADYGIKRKDYIEKFMANLDWGMIEERFMPTK